MVIALDIGGTHMRCAFVKKGKISKREIFNTPKERDKILERICKLIDKHKGKDPICVSVAGFIEDGVLLNTPNLDLNGFDLRKWLQNKYKKKVVIENDAICAAMAEQKYGLGKKMSNWVFLTIGTGIGGAIFINKKIYRGNGFAGEFGHMEILGDEFEKISSGKALENLIMQIHSNGIADLTNRAINEDPIAVKIYDIIIENLSTGISNIVYALDPESIIIGGGFSNIDFIPSKLIKIIREKDRLGREVNIINSKLKDDGSLIGAALLV